MARPLRCSKLCQGWKAGLMQFQLKLQFKPALLGMEVMVVTVAVAVPANSASSVRYGGHGCCCCSCSFSRPCLLCQVRRVGLLGQRENSRVGSDPAPLAFAVSDLRRGVGNDGQTIQVQQALPGMEGRVVAVPVAVAVAASSESSVRYGGHGCCCSSCSCSQL